MLIDTLKLILTGTEPLPPALLIYGEEEFLREEAYHAIMHKVLPEGIHHDIEIIDAENSSESRSPWSVTTCTHAKILDL